MSEEHINRLIEKIKIDFEIIKHQYDYFKNMTAVDTGAFILVIAFIERAFENPTNKFLVFISLVGFSLSLIFSLLVMSSYTKLMTKLWSWNFVEYTGLKEVETDVESLSKKLKKQRLWCSIFFFVGIVFLLVFAGVNILFEEPKGWY